MTKPTLEDIKDSIGHDASCDVSNAISAECNCTRRDKIALLERLQEPTEEMLTAGEDAFRLAEIEDDREGYTHFLREAFLAMLEVAERNSK